MEVSAKTTAIIGAAMYSGLIHMRRRQIFFEKKFHAIGRGLQQAEWPDARRSPAVLHVADNFAFQPNGIGHRREQNKERQRDLDHRDEDEVADSNFPMLMKVSRFLVTLEILH